MKQSLTFAALLFCGLIQVADAATYYVDALSGNDQWSGKRAASNATSNDGPWKSIAKVNASNFVAGDSILFKCGATWREQLNVYASGVAGKPITFGRYGQCTTTNLPTISGADLVTTWNALPYAGAIYVASAPFEVRQVFVDGKYMRLARYPNKGVLPAQPGSNFSRAQAVVSVNDAARCPAPQAPCRIAGLSDGALPARPASDFIGARVHVRSSQFAFEYRSTASFSAATRTLGFDAPTFYDFTAGHGYYLDNKLWMLDQPGEWFHDKAAGKLYLWLPNGDAPTAHVVEATRAGRSGLVVYDATNVVVRSLRFRQAEVGVDLTNDSNWLLDGVEISDSAKNAIEAPGSQAIRIERAKIARSALQGIWADDARDLSVRASSIADSGMVGSPHESIYAAIFCPRCDGAQIVDNTITNSAYIGIWHGNNNLVSGNYVKDSCLLLNDCGAIYTGNNDGSFNMSRVVNNVLVGSLGNTDGLPGEGWSTYGVYLDDYGNNVEVNGNTIVDADFGMVIHAGFNNLLKNNTVYRMRKGALFMLEDRAAPSMVNNQVSGNLFYPMGNERSIVAATMHTSIDFGQYQLNRYAPDSVHGLAREGFWGGQWAPDTDYTLLQWQRIKGRDTTSTGFDLFGAAPYRLLSKSAVNLIADGGFTQGAPVWNSYGAGAQTTYRATCVDGGCLRFRNGTVGTGALLSHNFALRKDKHYLVAFEMRAERENTSANLVVRQGGPNNYDALGLNRPISAGTAWRSYSFVFEATGTTPLAGESGARIDFEVGPGEAIEVDNVRVQEVTLQANDPSDDSMILFNSGATTKLMNCPFTGANAAKCTQFVDFRDGTNVVFPVALPAKSSKIILWASNPFKDSDLDNVADSDDLCPATPRESVTNVDEQGCAFEQRYFSAG
jgi:parallel beta-helix repeat protein